MKIRNTDRERKAADIARAVEIGALDPCAPLLSAVRFSKADTVHYRARGQRHALCGLGPCKAWPVARRSRKHDDRVCNACRASASRLRSFVRWAGIAWPAKIPAIKRAASW